MYTISLFMIRSIYWYQKEYYKECINKQEAFKIYLGFLILRELCSAPWRGNDIHNTHLFFSQCTQGEPFSCSVCVTCEAQNSLALEYIHKIVLIANNHFVGLFHKKEERGHFNALLTSLIPTVSCFLINVPLCVFFIHIEVFNKKINIAHICISFILSPQLSCE